MRDVDGVGIIYPRMYMNADRDKGWYWDRELKQALNRGAKIKIDDAMVFSSSPYLKNYV